MVSQKSNAQVEPKVEESKAEESGADIEMPKNEEKKK